jgi:hypothetical protein
MKRTKKAVSVLLSLMLVLGTVAVGLISVSASSNVVLTLSPHEPAAEAGGTMNLTLIVEGLGTDPDNNQISSVTFTSSDTSVVINAVASVAD